MASFLSGKKDIPGTLGSTVEVPCMVNTDHIFVVVPLEGSGRCVAFCSDGSTVQLDIAFMDLRDIVRAATQTQIIKARQDLDQK